MIGWEGNAPKLPPIISEESVSSPAHRWSESPAISHERFWKISPKQRKKVSPKPLDCKKICQKKPHPHLLVGLSAGWKTTEEEISTKSGKRKDPVIFSVVLETGIVLGIFPLLTSAFWYWALWHISYIFSWNNAWILMKKKKSAVFRWLFSVSEYTLTQWIWWFVFNVGFGLTELKGTVMPWRRYALYWVPF